MNSPISLIVPATLDMPGRSSGSFPITNQGTTTVIVTARVADDLNAHARQYPGASWLKVSPTSIRILPHHTGYLRLVAVVPRRIHGDHWANVVMTASERDGNGTVHVDAALAASVELTKPGHAVAQNLAALPSAVAHSQPPASPSSFPLLPVGGAGLFAALVLAAVVGVIFRRRQARLARSRTFVTELHDEEVAAR